MKEDRLEKFVRENRREFDSEEPRDSVWKEIDSRLAAPTKPSSDYSWVWKVAASVLFVLSAYLIFERNSRPPATELAVEALNQEFDNTEGYYISLISERRQELKTFVMEDSLMAREFRSDLSILDSVYQILKAEYGIFNEKKIENAMIQNLQWRLDILTQQMEILENIKQRKEDGNDQPLSI